MTVRMLKLGLLWLCLFSANSGFTNTPFEGRFDQLGSASAYQPAIERAREYIQVLLDSGAPGVSIAVGVGGEIVWAQGFGYADIENQVPVTSLTKFRVGSVSKSMTSIAMARLYEQGKLDLDAPIQKYLPQFPIKEACVITVSMDRTIL